MPELTDDEAEELWSYIEGGRFSGAARRLRAEFIKSRGWSEDEVNHVTASLSTRFGSSAWPPGTDGATSDAAPAHQVPTP